MRRTGLLTAVAFAAVLGGSGADAETPIPPSAPDFAMSAAQSDQYEIEAAHVALAQSQDRQVRAFADDMIKDHTKTSESLHRAVRASGLPPPPPAMSTEQAAMLAALQSLRGAQFDQTYARQQVLAHHQALAVGQSYAEAGTDTNLRQAAQAATPIIQHHLEMAKQLSTTLGGS